MNLLGEMVRGGFRRSGSAQSEETAEPTDVDLHYAAAREAATKSWHSRYGKIPSEELLDKITDAFLPPSFRRRPPSSDDADEGAPEPRPSRPPVAFMPRSPAINPRLGMPGAVTAPTRIAPFGPLAIDPNHPIFQPYELPEVQALAVLPMLAAHYAREAWLDSLGIDRAQMAAEGAEPTPIELAVGAIQDVYKGWDGRSFEVYAKQRRDDGTCLYGPGPKPAGKRCVYGGHDSGLRSPIENMMKRFADHYPSRDYNFPVLHQTTKSFGAGIGEEDRVIRHYRNQRRSDNRINAVDPDSWLAPVYRFKALQEFGPFVPPIE